MKAICKTASAALAALCCTACPAPYTYMDYAPVYMRRGDLEQSVKWAAPRELHNSGKIWTQGSQIFICERYKGVHVIDNQDPRHPARTAFIEIAGCLDIAVQGSILYADNAADLIAIDLDERRETARTRNAFRTIAAPNGQAYPQPQPSDSVIVDFKKQEQTDFYR